MPTTPAISVDEEYKEYSTTDCMVTEVTFPSIRETDMREKTIWHHKQTCSPSVGGETHKNHRTSLSKSSTNCDIYRTLFQAVRQSASPHVDCKVRHTAHRTHRLTGKYSTQSLKYYNSIVSN